MPMQHCLAHLLLPENEIKGHPLNGKLYLRKADKLIVLVKCVYYQKTNGVLTFYVRLQTSQRVLFDEEAPRFAGDYCVLSEAQII